MARIRPLDSFFNPPFISIPFILEQTFLYTFHYIS
nr:MAG TPA: hypothetical protein [Caudoviricetes sp.]